MSSTPGSRFLWLLLVLPLGCADYGAVARTQASNLADIRCTQLVLLQLAANAAECASASVSEEDIQSAKQREEARFTELFASGADLKAYASARAAVAQASSSGMAFKLAKADIDRDYLAQKAARTHSAQDLAGLHLALVDALEVLHASGEDLHEYLALPWYRRLFEDVRGMDPEALRAVGDELKAYGQRLRPLVLD